MKKFILKSVYAAGLVCGAMTFASCELDRLPETVLADNNFWQSEVDMRGACNQLYVDLPGFGHDTRADDVIGKNVDNISAGTRSVPATSGDWTNPYKKIAVANNIIEKGNASSGLSEAQKKRWTAEAYFFRAYHYFDLVKKYGDVPLILKAFDSTGDPDIKKARTPRAEVIAQIYEDLLFAEENLPDIDAISDDDWGRVSKSAARGMLVRVGLYEGTHGKYHNPSSNYKADLKIAIDAAERLINSGKHDLYANYQNLFLFDGEGRQNKENVFVKVYGPNGSGAIIYHNNCRQLENTVSVTRQAVDEFLYTDGLPREKSELVVEEQYHNDVFTNRDPRLAMTIYHKEETAYKGGYQPFGNQHGNGYGIKKGYLQSEWDSNSRETIDKMIIRYAEVLLSYAEALYEYNGNITDAQLEQTVNKVRARAGFNVKLTNAFASANGLNILDEIRRERHVEFIDEGLRYDDIIRWKTAETVLPKAMLGLKYNDADLLSTTRDNIEQRLTSGGGYYNGVKVADQDDIYVIEDISSRSFNPDKDYLYPIPTYEIATSDGNVEQNPIWR